MPSQFHERLTFVRKRAGKTLGEMGDIVGLTTQGYRQWEAGSSTGTVVMPGVWKLLTLCRELDVALVSYMLNDSVDVEDVVPFGLDVGTGVGLARALQMLMKVPREVREAAEALCLQPDGALIAARMLLAVVDSQEARNARRQ